ncbi:MAG TPA: DUF5999 family protein [Mycobacteriales bacterium]|nr:DUF5999 family protein [Mycobacteriales bacterium]
MAECQHQPRCPSAEAADRDAARVVASHPEQGWSLLCNGVVSFDDSGDLLPDGNAVPPQRTPGAPHASAA